MATNDVPNATHDYAAHAAEYAKLGFEGTYYLAFRDLHTIFQKHAISGRALDYGCGTGRSTRFLKNLGCDSIGVDIDPAMLAEARRDDANGEYHQIQSAQLPFENETFDVVFSSFVFMELPTLDQITAIFSEMKRVLKPDGVVVNVTVPVLPIGGNWASFTFDFPENNRDIKSGDTVRVAVRGTNVVFDDYYWSDDDYRTAYEHAGLRVRDVHTPLGREDDGIKWLDEQTTPFVYVYVLEPVY